MSDDPSEVSAAEPAPDPRAAALALRDARHALHTHPGRRSGPDWEAKLQAYRDAWAGFEAGFQPTEGGGE